MWILWSWQTKPCIVLVPILNIFSGKAQALGRKHTFFFYLSTDWVFFFFYRFIGRGLYREAGTVALRENINILTIGKRHLDQVLASTCARAKQLIDGGVLDCYQKFQNDHSI